MKAYTFKQFFEQLREKEARIRQLKEFKATLSFEEADTLHRHPELMSTIILGYYLLYE